MNWDAIGAIAETLSAVAVLATLIYLSIQIRTSRREHQAESIRANRQERREFFTTLRDSPYIPAILSKMRSGDELTQEEQTRLLAHTAAHWGLLYSEWVQSKIGWQGQFATSIEARFHYAFSQPGATKMLEKNGKKLYPSEFIEDAYKAWQTYEPQLEDD